MKFLTNLSDFNIINYQKDLLIRIIPRQEIPPKISRKKEKKSSEMHGPLGLKSGQSNHILLRN